MTNRELKNIIQEIEEKERLTFKEIAEKVVLDRSNLSTFVNNEKIKPVTPRMAGKFRKHFAKYFPPEKPEKQQIQHNPSFEQWAALHLSPMDYINDLKEDKKQAKIREDKIMNQLAANLTAMMQMLSALQRHDQAFHETILRSLSRIEGGNVDLVLEAHSSEADQQVRAALQGSTLKSGT